MQIKRFEARDMTSALRLIKHELGPDAVILSARSLKVANRFLGSAKTSGVEVTAATDSYDSAPLSSSVPYAGARTIDDQRSRPGGPGKEILTNPVQNRIKSFAHRKAFPKNAHRHSGRNTETHGRIFEHLLAQGVRPNVAHDLIKFVKKENGASQLDLKDQMFSKITAAIEQKRDIRVRRFEINSQGRVLAFIGPTGVGKTTAIAKLAAKQAIQQNKRIALITIDSQRIAAAKELKIYGKAIGIPVKTAATPSAFKAAVNALQQHDLILVDTPGVNSENQGEIDELRSYLETIDSIGIHLLLSAGTKEADLVNTIERLRSIPIQHLIITKLDESATFGNLINLLVENQIPLSFLTTGREVPDSIETASVERIVKYLLGSFMNQSGLANSGDHNHPHLTTAGGQSEDDYVANKNSDVFHRMDCKWTLKIKPKNMITFSSVQEAQKQHFVPCRDCRPTSSNSVAVDTSENDTMRISNYF